MPRNSQARNNPARDILTRSGIMPVVTVANAEQGVAIARALLAGGLTAIEVTLRSAAALDAVRAIKQATPQLLVGVGTVCNAGHVRAAEVAGADFLVSPGTTPALADALLASALPCIPGAATPSEIMALLEHGFECVKLFPASALGGITRIKALAGPFPNLRLCPTGGIGEHDAADYLAQPNVLCVGGSWMVASEWIKAGDFAAVTASAAKARALIDQLGG
jgi:2-dehydro-3-deoxyphosphogluconate aldolase/(4S)-4-hydroxy-2-oxoglutarate aldolase